MSEATKVNLLSRQNQQPGASWQRHRKNKTKSQDHRYSKRSLSKQREKHRDKTRHGFEKKPYKDSRYMNYGSDHSRKRDACPAFGCTCYKCQCQNNYCKMCLSKRVSTLQCNEDEIEYDSSDNDFVIGSL